MMCIHALIPTTLVLCAVAQVPAAVTLASPFTDHAVLQRELPVPVWGTGNAGETVTVTCTGVKTIAVAGADGRWKAVLAPLPAGGPYELTVSGSSTIVLTDVLVGEVWLCSGQSNMQWQVKQAQDGANEVARAQHPRIRLFQVKRGPGVPAEQPAANCTGSWQPCTPKSVADFSAVGFFFGRELQRALDVPVGLIDSSWGGTPAETWVSSQALESSPVGKPVFALWKKYLDDFPAEDVKFRTVTLPAWEKAKAAAKQEGKPEPKRPREPLGPKTPQHRPAALYNGMIAPLAPYALRGAIWYQGETNASAPERALEYRDLLGLLIQDWRTAFTRPIAFHIVQLANYGKDDLKDPSDPWPVDAWALLRESQARTAEEVPHCGLAVTIDIGNPADIHPTNKQEVGRRLALNALAKNYGKTLEYSGPVFKAMTVAGSVAVLSFDHAAGLSATGGTLSGFAIAGADGRFRPAAATITDGTVHVSHPEIATPVAVRYGWGRSPVCTLVNQASLPAVPFRHPRQ